MNIDLDRSNWNRIHLSTLMTNVVRYWVMTKNECTLCHRFLYAHRGSTSPSIFYQRCPHCRENFYNVAHSRIFDKPAEKMLDVLARRVELPRP